MRLNPKYFKVRLTLLVLPLMTLVIATLSMWLVAGWMDTREDLESATLIIDKIQPGSETETRFLKDKIRRFVDINVKNQPWSIHLSDEYPDNSLDRLEEYSTGDTIEILYYNYLFFDGIFHNPSEVKINGDAVISFEETHEQMSWLLLAVISGILLLSFLSFLAFKTYKELMWEGDKAIYAQSKWLFFKRWFR